MTTGSPPRVSPSTMHLWIDADPSGLVWTGLDCDDDLAILSSLHLNQTRDGFTLHGLSICGGNAPLDHTWADVHLLLQHAGVKSRLPTHRGYGWRSMHVSRKVLKWLNAVAPDMVDSDDAADAIIAASKQHALTILTLGPTTNVAKAIEKDPTLTDRIDHIYLMGGELTQSRMDLNFVSDRAAARNIVEANVPTTLITIQTCAQTAVTKQIVDNFESKCCPSSAACSLLPKMRQQIQIMPHLVNRHVLPKMKKWPASQNLPYGFIPWDMVALLAISHPELFREWKYHHVSFPTCQHGEPCNMDMVVQDHYEELDALPGIFNHSGVVRVPHFVRNETELLQTTFDLLCAIPAHGPRPRMLFGFMGPVASGIAVTVMFLLWRL
jgi:inosine-uridine nucleoside N-ribohydrolase